MDIKYQKLFEEGNKEQLERMLEKEGKKSGWDNINIEFALNRIIHNKLKIDDIIQFITSEKDNDKKGSINRIKKEAADIANFAHMIIHKCNSIIENYND